VLAHASAPVHPTHGFTVDIGSGLMWCTPCGYLAGPPPAYSLSTAQSQLSTGSYDNTFALGTGANVTPSWVLYKESWYPTLLSYWT
jgi:hypothetical protein